MKLRNPGVLGRTELISVIRGASPIITTIRTGGIRDDQIETSAVNLTIGSRVYGMSRMTLPQPGQKIEELVAQADYDFDLAEGQLGFLHKNYTYLIPLNETVQLPKGFTATFSPRSSIGRVDVFVRVLADGVPLYDRLPDEYCGKLWLEVTPLSFCVRVFPGLSMTQMRLKLGDARLTSQEVRIRQAKDGILWNQDGTPVKPQELRGASHGIYMHVDLKRDIVGFRSRRSAPPLSLNASGSYDPDDFWEPIRRPKNGRIDLEPGEFCLLATSEAVRIPKDVCGEIMPYDAAAGEFRTHYAGYFHPGFGGEKGTIGVLELRGRESSHSLSDGQPICLMAFEHLCSPLSEGYDGEYTDPRPSLSKFFDRRLGVWEGI